RAVVVGALGLHAHINELWHWLLLNGLVATVGCAMVGNLVVNVTMAKWFVEKRGQAVAWAAMGVSFGGIGMVPLVTVGIDALGWREAWMWLAVAVGFLMYPVAVMMRRAPEDHGLHPDGKSAAEVAGGQAARAAEDYALSLTRRQALRTVTFYLLVAAFGMFTMNLVVLLLQAVPYLTDAGFSRTEAALAITVASVPAMASKPIWGFFIDRLKPKPLAALGAGTTGVALLFIVLAVQAGSLGWIYAAFALMGLGWGGMIPLQEVIWASFFGRRYLGAVRSAGLPFTLLLGAAAPLAVSYYHDLSGSYDNALICVAALNLISGSLLLAIPSPKTAGATS
ncbi:MAG: MFS transporter, partial [Gammaproteobacteria bacterium]|nr:MFS transporter [Gammaproteobacteria bacterium]